MSFSYVAEMLNRVAEAMAEQPLGTTPDRQALQKAENESESAGSKRGPH